MSGNDTEVPQSLKNCHHSLLELIDLCLVQQERTSLCEYRFRFGSDENYNHANLLCGELKALAIAAYDAALSSTTSPSRRRPTTCALQRSSASRTLFQELMSLIDGGDAGDRARNMVEDLIGDMRRHPEARHS